MNFSNFLGPNLTFFLVFFLFFLFFSRKGYHFRIEKVEMNQFRISRNQIVHGLLPGVKLDVVFPGFPTMKHIPHIAELRFADIKVFQQPSKKQSMVLKIANRPELEKVSFLKSLMDLFD